MTMVRHRRGLSLPPLWTFYPSASGQAIPSATNHYAVAETAVACGGAIIPRAGWRYRESPWRWDPNGDRERGTKSICGRPTSR